MECVALGGGRNSQSRNFVQRLACRHDGPIATIRPEVARSQESVFLPKIEVIATSPLSRFDRTQQAGAEHGGENSSAHCCAASRTKKPASTATDRGFDPDAVAEDFSRTYSPSITDTLMQRVPRYPPLMSRATDSPRISANRGFAPRRCKAPRKGSPSI